MGNIFRWILTICTSFAIYWFPQIEPKKIKVVVTTVEPDQAHMSFAEVSHKENTIQNSNYHDDNIVIIL